MSDEVTTQPATPVTPPITPPPTETSAPLVTPQEPVTEPVIEMPPAGGVPAPVQAPPPEHKNTLGITLAAGVVVLLLGLGSIYWFTNQSIPEETVINTSPLKMKTPTSATATTTDSTDVTISATPVSTGVASTDIDSELKSLDSSISSVKTTDFDDAALADTSLGL